jgi:hypothetical protein
MTYNINALQNIVLAASSQSSSLARDHASYYKPDVDSEGTGASELRRSYSERIHHAWKQTISTTRNLGKTIVSSRIDMPPEMWKEFVLEDTPFDLTVACRVIKVTQNLQIPGVAIAETNSFYDVLRLEEPIFRFGVDNGLITSSATPSELAALKKKFKAANNR